LNEQTLTQEFERAVYDEPPLGFDPDQVVSRAGQRRHRRRTSMLAGGGVAAVALLAAVAAPLLRGGSGAGEQVQTAGSPTAQGPSDGKALWPPAGVTPVHPTDAQLSPLNSSIAATLERVLPKVAPDAGRLQITSHRVVQLHVGGLETNPSALGADATAHVGPTDKGYLVDVAAMVPEAPVKPFAPEDVCAAAKQQISTVTCHYNTVADGGILVTMDWATDWAGTLQHRISVTDYRPDGSYMEARSTNDLRADGQPPLTVDQLTKLATDPGFKLS
jgi:hypothetical protein